MSVSLLERRRLSPRSSPVANIKIVVIGEPATGKTSLVQSFCSGKSACGSYDPTVGVDPCFKMIPLRDKQLRLNIWDTSGDPEFVDVRNEFYKEAHGLILVFDVTQRRSFQVLDAWLGEAAKYGTGNLPCTLVGMKIDSGPRMVPELAARDWAREKGLSYFEASAVVRKNVDEAFEDLAVRLGAS